VYGGEYDELSRLFSVVVKGWLAVGLKPHFVFDGEAYCNLDFIAWAERFTFLQVHSPL
jgi:hypothetical protein